MKTLFPTCAALLLAIQVVSAQNIIPLVRNCFDHHIERLNECVVGAVEKMNPRMVTGIPELNLPRLEPLDLGSFNLSQSVGPVTFKADFSDLLVSGLRRWDIKYFDVNYKDLTVFVGVTVPGLTIRGKYNIDGKVFQLPVEGTGPFIALLEGLVIEGRGTLRALNRRVTRIDSLNFDVKVHKFRSKVENLFGGNDVLQNTFTHFIEENSNLVLEEVRPGLVSKLDEFLTGVANMIVSALPADILATHPDANKLDKHRARTLRIQAESRKQ